MSLVVSFEMQEFIMTPPYGDNFKESPEMQASLLLHYINTEKHKSALFELSKSRNATCRFYLEMQRLLKIMLPSLNC